MGKYTVFLNWKTQHRILSKLIQRQERFFFCSYGQADSNIYMRNQKN